MTALEEKTLLIVHILSDNCHKVDLIFHRQP